MKSVFAHDHVFLVWEGRVYSPGKFPYKSWARYLEHFSTLTVIARAKVALCADDVRGLGRADGPRVSFAFQDSRSGRASLLGSGGQKAMVLHELIRSADAVIARLPSRVGVRVAGLARKLDRPLAVEVVGSALHSFWYHGALSAKLYGPILDLQTKWATRRARFALYVTRSYLQRRYPCEGVTASASNVSITRTDPELLLRRKERVLKRKGPLVIGFVGTLITRYKGIDTLLRAVSKLHAMGVPCLLKVVGEGDPRSWRDVARSLNVQELVEFVGTVPGTDDVRKWMQSIDVFVLPSKTEGLPRALIEAMSCGCLSFATDVGGIPELLPRASMIRPGDSERLANLLREATLNPTLLADAVFENAAIAERYMDNILDDVRRRFFGELAQHALRNPPAAGVLRC